MAKKYYISEGEAAPDSQIGATLEALATTIAARREANEESYTFRLLTGKVDELIKKVMEEAGEVALAVKDVEALDAMSAAHVRAGKAGSIDELEAARDHLRYESADVVYHLLVVLERYGISIDEFAAELNARMTTEERPEGAVLILDEHINRG